MRNVKRVKSTHPEPTQAPRYDASAPKTSEYAFFKRLKKDIDGTNYSRTRFKEPKQLKTTNAYSHTEASTNFNTFKYMEGNLRSSSRAERGGPTNDFSLLTPVGFQSDKLGAGNNRDICSDMKEMVSLFSDNDTRVGGNVFPSPFAGAAKNLGTCFGNQYTEKGIFSAKRQKLRQLVADTYPEFGEFSSKGFDSVSTLISRLFPRGHETKLYQYSDSKEGIIDTRHQSPDFPEPDHLEKISTHYVPKFQHGSYWNNAFSEYWSRTPREKALSTWDMAASDFPLTRYDAETSFHGEEAICGFDGETIKSLCRERDSSSRFLFEKRRFTGPDHLKKLDDIYDLYEPAIREPRSILLSWDAKEKKEKNLYSTLTTSLDVAHKPIMDDTLGDISIHSSSLCLNHDLDFYSCLCFHSSYALMHELGRDHEDDYAVAEAGQFYSGLSSSRKYLSIGEDCDTYNHLQNNTINLISKDHPWYTSEMSGNEGDFEALQFSRGLHADLGWKFLPVEDFYAKYSSNYPTFQFPIKEDFDLHAALQDDGSGLYCSKPRETTLVSASDDSELDIPDWSFANFHVCADRVIGHSLLLDCPGMVRSHEEIDLEDDK